MKSDNTTHEAEAVTEITLKIRSSSIPQQIEDEQLVLNTIMQALRGLRTGGRPGVTSIAREWERIINYRIQITMQERQRRARALVLRLQVTQVRSAERGTRNGIDTSPGAGTKFERRTSSGPVTAGPPSPQSGEGFLPVRGGEGPRERTISSRSGVHIRLSVSPSQD